MRRAAPAATLIEEDETVSVGIEIASPAGDRTRARAAVNHERWFPVWIAALLPIDLMPVAHIHQALLVWLNWRVELGHACLSDSGCTAQASRVCSGSSLAVPPRSRERPESALCSASCTPCAPPLEHPVKYEYCGGSP